MNIDRHIPPVTTDFPVMSIKYPEVVTLPNGIKIDVIDRKCDDVVRLDMIFDGGTLTEEEPLVADITASMLQEGTKKYNGDEIANAIDFYGANLMSVSSNDCSLVILRSLSRHFAQIIKIAHSILTEPIFDEIRLQTMLNRKISQYEVNCDRVQYLAQRALYDAVYGETHPYSCHESRESYERITREKLSNYFNKNYFHRNCHMILSGSITDDILKLVSDAFGAIDYYGDCDTPYIMPKATTTPNKLIKISKEGTVQAAINMALVLDITRKSPDFIPLRILNTIFGGYFGSRLMSNIREEKGYTYNISSNILGMKNNSMLVVNTECAVEVIDEVIEEVKKEMIRLRTEEIDETELSIVRQYMRGELSRITDTAFSEADWWLSSTVNHSPKEYFENQDHCIVNITPKQINQLACKYLNPNNIITIIAG